MSQLLPLFLVIAVIGRACVPAEPPQDPAKRSHNQGQEALSPDKPGLPILYQEITVTATRSAEDAKVLPQSLTILTPEEVESRAARTPNQMLREEPGVYSVQVASQGSPIIRGQIGNRVLYLWDGIRINNGALFSGPNGFFNQFPYGSVDRMDVIRGPGAVQYGSDAVGGVINILERPVPPFSMTATKFGGELFSQFGTVDSGKSSAARFWISSGRLAANGSASGQAVGDYAAPGFGHIANTGFDGVGGHLNVAFRMNGRQTFRALWLHERRFDVATYTQSKMNANGIPRICGPYEQRGILRFGYDFEALGAWSRNLKLYGYHQYYDAERDTTVQSKPSLARTESQTVQRVTGGGAQNTLYVGDNHVTFGGDHRTEALQTEKSLYTTVFATGQTVLTKPNGNVPNGDYNVTDAFGIASFHPLARLNATVGVRFESSVLQSFPRAVDPLPPFTIDTMHLHKRWNAVTWNAGVVYNLTGGLSVVANTATGYRAPTFSDTLSISVPVYASGVASVPSTAVRPERSLTSEAGLRFASGRLAFSATAFSNQLHDTLASTAVGVIAIPGVGVVTAMQNSNISRGYVRGVETSFSLKLVASTTLFANFAYTHGIDELQHVPLRFIPPPFGTAGLRWVAPKRHFWAEATVNMADRMRTHAPQDEIDAGFSLDPGYGSPSATNPPYRADFSMPGYAVANLRAGLPVWSHGRCSFELNVALNNLLNHSYREAYSQQQLRAPGFGAVLGGRLRF